MNSPVWILVYYGSPSLTPTQWVIRCSSESAANAVLYHNRYYGRRCLRVRVKEWK